MSPAEPTRACPRPITTVMKAKVRRQLHTNTRQQGNDDESQISKRKARTIRRRYRAGHGWMQLERHQHRWPGHQRTGCRAQRTDRQQRQRRCCRFRRRQADGGVRAQRGQCRAACRGCVILTPCERVAYNGPVVTTLRNIHGPKHRRRDVQRQAKAYRSRHRDRHRSHRFRMRGRRLVHTRGEWPGCVLWMSVPAECRAGCASLERQAKGRCARHAGRSGLTGLSRRVCALRLRGKLGHRPAPVRRFYR